MELLNDENKLKVDEIKQQELKRLKKKIENV